MLCNIITLTHECAFSKVQAGQGLRNFSMQMSRIWKFVGTLALTVPILTACSQEHVKSFEDVRVLVDETADSVCRLDLSAFAVDLSAPDTGWADLLKSQNLAETGDGDRLSRAYRRIALKHRLMAGDTEPNYDAFSEPALAAPLLNSHLKRVRYWHSELRRLSGAPSAQVDQATHTAHNSRACIVNEQVGAAMGAARQAVLQAWSTRQMGDRQEVLDTALALADMSGPHYEPYLHAWVSKLETPANLTEYERGAIALMRRGSAVVMGFDPKSLPDFVAWRMAEVDATFAYIDNQTTHDPVDDSLAQELVMRVNLDQSLRYIFQNQGHFSPEGGSQSELWGLIGHADTVNTARLKTLSETRDWFRDDRDGPAAAHAAFVLVQHADRDPDFQREMLPRIEAAIGQPGVGATSYAYLFDRVAGKDNKLQRYGTQGRCIADGLWEPNAVEDPDRLNERRADVGLGLIEDYILQFEERCKAPDPMP